MIEDLMEVDLTNSRSMWVYEIGLGYRDGDKPEVKKLGDWEGEASSDDEARKKALDALWDNRLDSASCTPVFHYERKECVGNGRYMVVALTIDAMEHELVETVRVVEAPSGRTAWRNAAVRLLEGQSFDGHASLPDALKEIGKKVLVYRTV
jgi:hypothetical protein